MRYKVNLVGPAAAIDWSVFRLEGDAYLRRLDLPEDVAMYLAAKLYLANWQCWKTGRKWDAKRGHWLKDRAWQSAKGPQVLDPRTGKMVPPCMAPDICEECGGWCTQSSLRCRDCWEKIRPRKKRPPSDAREPDARGEANPNPAPPSR